MAGHQERQTNLISPLKVLRIRAGLSQAELAKKLSVDGKTISDRAISAWERGEYQPELRIPQMKALCKALGVSLDELPDNLEPTSSSITTSSSFKNRIRASSRSKNGAVGKVNDDIRSA